jgi:hypothetical protein
MRALGEAAHCSYQTVYNLEHGRAPGTSVAASLDRALHAGGALIAAARRDTEEADVDRRKFLTRIAAVTAAAPLLTSDTIRDSLLRTLDQRRHPDAWDEAVAEYAVAFYATDPRRLVHDLTADLAVLEAQIASARNGQRATLCRAAGQLAAVAAMAWSSTGDGQRARWWWQTARHAADASQDRAAQVWVRGWEVANGSYEQRPTPIILARAAEADTIAGDQVSAGAAGLYAGLAQTLAIAGRRTEALTALDRVAAITDRLGRDVVADEGSMFGWPEVRLRHTESFVHTALGNTGPAYKAQDQALALYPANLARERAAMLLHRSICLVRTGDIGGGLAFATQTLDDLPAADRTELVHAIGRQAVAAIPAPSRGRADVRGFAERVAERQAA